jgi:hypothetical protein
VAFGYAVFGAFNVTCAGIVIKKKTGWLPLLTGVAALVNVGANFLLIPSMGAMGAAIATLLAFACLTVTAGVVSQRKLPVVYEAGRLFHLYLVVGVCLSAGLLLPHLAPGADLWIRVGALVATETEASSRYADRRLRPRSAACASDGTRPGTPADKHCGARRGKNPWGDRHARSRDRLRLPTVRGQRYLPDRAAREVSEAGGP